MTESNAAPLVGLPIRVVGETIFVPLPKALQRPIKWGCMCAYCTAHPHETPMWDTLALSKDSRFTWTVHAPEMHVNPGSKTWRIDAIARDSRGPAVA